MTGVADTAALRDVLAERAGQITREGWTPAHDDAHRRGQIAFAAGCYAINAARTTQVPPCARPVCRLEAFAPPYSMWPWDLSWWKPKSPREDLVRAAALILAEIERMDRASSARP